MEHSAKMATVLEDVELVYIIGMEVAMKLAQLTCAPKMDV